MFFSMPGCILPLERALSCGNGAVSLMRKWQAYDGDACDLAGFPVILAEAGAWHGLCGRGGCRRSKGRRSANHRSGRRAGVGRATGGWMLSGRGRKRQAICGFRFARRASKKASTKIV